MDVFCEKSEDAPHQEGSYQFGRVIFFQRFGEAREVRGHVASDPSRDAAGIERARIEPDGAKAVADGLCFQLLKQNAVGKRIGKRHVSLAGARKVSEEFNGITDIDDDQEGWPTISHR